LVGELSPRWVADPVGAEAALPAQLPTRHCNTSAPPQQGLSADVKGGISKGYFSQSSRNK